MSMYHLNNETRKWDEIDEVAPVVDSHFTVDEAIEIANNIQKYIIEHRG